MNRLITLISLMCFSSVSFGQTMSTIPQGLRLVTPAHYSYACAVAKDGKVLFTEYERRELKQLNQDGTTTIRRLGFPGMYGIAVDTANNIYVALDITDTNAAYLSKITKITPNGTETNIVTNIRRPRQVTTDTAGNVYFTTESSGIYKWTKSTNTKSLLVDSIAYPTAQGVAVAADGTMYFSIYGSPESGITGSVYKRATNGTITTILNTNIWRCRGLVINSTNDYLYLCTEADQEDQGNSGLLAKIKIADGTMTKVLEGIDYPEFSSIGSNGNIYFTLGRDNWLAMYNPNAATAESSWTNDTTVKLGMSEGQWVPGGAGSFLNIKVGGSSFAFTGNISAINTNGTVHGWIRIPENLIRLDSSQLYSPPYPAEHPAPGVFRLPSVTYEAGTGSCLISVIALRSHQNKRWPMQNPGTANEAPPANFSEIPLGYLVYFSWNNTDRVNTILSPSYNETGSVATILKGSAPGWNYQGYFQNATQSWLNSGNYNYVPDTSALGELDLGSFSGKSKYVYVMWHKNGAYRPDSARFRLYDYTEEKTLSKINETVHADNLNHGDDTYSGWRLLDNKKLNITPSTRLRIFQTAPVYSTEFLQSDAVLLSDYPIVDNTSLGAATDFESIPTLSVSSSGSTGVGSHWGMQGLGFQYSVTNGKSFAAKLDTNVIKDLPVGNYYAEVCWDYLNTDAVNVTNARFNVNGTLTNDTINQNRSAVNQKGSFVQGNSVGKWSGFYRLNGIFTHTLANPIIVSANYNSTLYGTKRFVFDMIRFIPIPLSSTVNSVITASADTILADGVSTALITVQLKDSTGYNLTRSGGIVIISSTAGTISSTTDNNDGTYSATITSNAAPAMAVLSFSINGVGASSNKKVNFVGILQPAAPLGNGLDFDGTNDYVATSAYAAFGFGNGNFTMETWVKTTDSINPQNLIVSNNSGYTIVYTLALNNGKLKFDIGNAGINGLKNIADGNWHHIAGIRNGSNLSLYVDGILDNTGTTSASPATSDLKLYLGNNSTLSGSYFKGKLDEVRIWNIARSQALIQQNMNGELTDTTQAGLIAYYKFNQGVACGTNTTISTIRNSTDTTKTGILYNFSKTSSGSNFVPGFIPGSTTNLCVSSPLQIINKIVGGTWSSSNPSKAIVNTTGVVTGVSAGNVNINYTYSNGSSCSSVSTTVVNVNDLPVLQKNTSNSLRFDGINDYISLDTGAVFRINNAITLEAWVKVNAFDKTWQTIIAKGDNSWRLHRYNTSNYIAFGTSNLSTLDLVSTVGINDGAWHHIAGVYDGSYKYLYIDGVLNASIATTGSFTYSPDYAVYIGENAQSTNRYFNGWIDELRIWNIARSQSQIQASMERQLAINETGLVAYYNFNQGIASGNNTTADTFLINKSLNANNGKLKNFALSGTSSNWVSGYANDSVSICVGKNIQLNNSTAGGVWTSLDTNIVMVNSGTGYVVAISPGITNITYTYTNINGCTTSKSTTINVSPLPNADFTLRAYQGSIYILTPVYNTGVKYYWYLNNNTYVIKYDGNAILADLSSGNYGLVVTNPSGCKAGSNYFPASALLRPTKTSSTTIVPNGQNLIQVYPNPAHDKITVQLIKGMVDARIMVINVLGITVATDNLKGLQRNISLSGKNAGTYFIKIINENGNSIVKKIILE